MEIFVYLTFLNVSDGTDLAQRKDFDIKTKVCNQLCKTFFAFCLFHKFEEISKKYSDNRKMFSSPQLARARRQ